MLRVLTALSTGLLLAGCSVLGVRSGTEEPPHAVVDRLGERVEVRRYAPRTAAEVTIPARDEEAGRNAAFRGLFAYITGANRSDAEVAMTVPVETASAQKIAMTVPVETTAGGSGTVMRFFLPSRYTAETAPVPTDPRVRIVAVPEELLAVLRYTGSTSVEAAAERKGELLDLLDESAWRPVGEPVTLFYDPPWTVWFLRRNEAAVRVAPR